jgi:hypothetical protein
MHASTFGLSRVVMFTFPAVPSSFLPFLAFNSQSTRSALKTELEVYIIPRGLYPRPVLIYLAESIYSTPLLSHSRQSRQQYLSKWLILASHQAIWESYSSYSSYSRVVLSRVEYYSRVTEVVTCKPREPKNRCLFNY